MRVTNNMIASNTLRNLNRNLSRLDKRNTQLSTGKRINKPSDDPIGTSRALRLRSDVSQIEQYKKNTDAAISWLNITESATKDLYNIIHKAKELAVQGASETYSQNDRNTIADEMEQLRDQIIQLGNSTYTGRYIFSGFQTDEKTFNADGRYNITTTSVQNKKYQVSVGEEIEVGVFGTDLFGKPDSSSSPANKAQIISDFDKAIQGLTDPMKSSQISTFISDIEGHLNNVLSVTSEIGAKTNRLELVQNRLEQNNLDFTDLLSENEDVDMAETIMHMKMEESVYRASLSAGSRVIQPTLIDFIQ
ncbi:flagellar hook-associated protein FlgL [Wukongibacter sp. M2B1]|uniref:flagellar hook-associated protein FlgL n=1 Tax=Wukongibacter sp. M2B1 TaxID=3088895 RepID=UPI003D7BEDC7